MLADKIVSKVQGQVSSEEFTAKTKRFEELVRKDEGGKTLLVKAVTTLLSPYGGSNIEEVKSLINEGSLIDEKDSQGRTPLMHAIKVGKREMDMRELKKHMNFGTSWALEPEPFSSYLRSMYPPSDELNTKVIAYLIKMGADTSAVDNEGKSVDDYFALYNDKASVEERPIEDGDFNVEDNNTIVHNNDPQSMEDILRLDITLAYVTTEYLISSDEYTRHKVDVLKELRLEAYSKLKDEQVDSTKLRNVTFGVVPPHGRDEEPDWGKGSSIEYRWSVDQAFKNIRTILKIHNICTDDVEYAITQMESVLKGDEDALNSYRLWLSPQAYIDVYKY